MHNNFLDLNTSMTDMTAGEEMDLDCQFWCTTPNRTCNEDLNTEYICESPCPFFYDPIIGRERQLKTEWPIQSLSSSITRAEVR